jgi:hypothetical protein
VAPESVLRYLVTHEAVHLAILDHSQRFWLTLQSLCPETDRARQWLAANGTRLQVALGSHCRHNALHPARPSPNEADDIS